MFRRALRFLWWLGAALLVLLAVSLSVARLLVPEVSAYREQIEAVAAGVFSRPVSIGTLDAAWQGLSPVLEFGEVVVSDANFPGGELRIERVEIAIDVVETLLTRKLHTSGVSLSGTRLELQTDVRQARAHPSLQAVLSWLLSQHSLALKDVQLQWRDPGLFASPLSLSDVTAKLVNTGQQHRFLAETKLPAAQGESLKLAADLKGRPDDPSTWNGTLYLRGRAAQVAELQPALSVTGLRAAGKLNLQLWMGIEAALPVWGSGDLEWRDFAVTAASADAQGVAADNLSARFHWRRQAGGWRVGVRDFSLFRDAQVVWPASRFDLRVRHDDGWQLRGQASELVLQELTAVLPLLPWADNDALAALDRLQPRGHLRDAGFSFAYRPGEAPAFAIRSAVDDLTLASSGGLPGVSGVSGTVAGNLQSGVIRLNSPRAELVLPKVFPAPLALTGLIGELSWQRYGDRLRLQSDQLRVHDQGLRLLARARLDWRYDASPPWLDLQVAADSLPLAQVRDHLPSGVMSPKLVTWMRQAFQGGTASGLRLVLQGPLDATLLQTGRLEARFDFDDAGLDYHQGWQPLEGMSGQALFSGRGMRIEAHTAVIDGAPVERLVASIADLHQPLLEVRGTVDSTLASMFEFIRHSPLHAHFATLVDGTDTRGDARLQLHLTVPLKHQLGKLRVHGDLLLAGNDLLPRAGEIGLRDIHGKLVFTRHDVSMKDARARLLDRPVALAVYKQGSGDDAATVVSAQGRLDLVAQAHQAFPASADWLRGATGWQVLLQIGDSEQAARPRVSLRLYSGLQGVAVDLPEPLAKTAQETRSLSVEWVPGKLQQVPLRIHYGDGVNASVLLTPALGVRKAGLSFGATPATLPTGDELRVSGQLAQIDLGRWLRLLRRAHGGGQGQPPPLALDLRTDLLRFGDLGVSKVAVFSEADDSWYYRIEGEGAAGWLRWIRGSESLAPQLLARLRQLRVATESGAESAAGETATLEPQPTKLPRLNIEIKDLHWDGRELGEFTVVADRVRDGVRFEQLKLKSKAIDLDGGGEWLLVNQVPSSRFQAVIRGGSLQRLSQWFGGGSIKGGKLSGKMELGWQGSPADFSLARMNGEFDLEARDGRLENIDEGAGKLLSLFSLNSLQRRLSLDFSDVVKEGLSYNRMRGRFVVMDGDAFTNDFSLEGTSVDIQVAGRTGLIKHDYDQLITVTPQVTSTLPIAGAIAGGPLVGAAALLADKLLGERFNRLTRVQYQVTGSWDKPVFTKLKKEQAGESGQDSESAR